MHVGHNQSCGSAQPQGDRKAASLPGGEETQESMMSTSIYHSHGGQTAQPGQDPSAMITMLFSSLCLKSGLWKSMGLESGDLVLNSCPNEICHSPWYKVVYRSDPIVLVKG